MSGRQSVILELALPSQGYCDIDGSLPVGPGKGVASFQRYRHSRPIDRFEGVYRLGNRERAGRCGWRTGRWYRGAYHWRRDCLRYNEKCVAIGVPLGIYRDQ